jgi:catechol 2,3-dioxygenase-like lactoylglutathione lyase family enzyme
MSRQAGQEDRVEVLPLLPTLSIAETREFYREKLGFEDVVHEDDAYLILRRSFAGAPMELHFWLTDDRRICESSGVYIRSSGIDILHEEFTRRGVPKLTPIALRPWNMEEFYVWDPHGNLLKFGRVPSGPSAS